MTTANSRFVDTSGWAAPVVRDTPNYQAMEAFSRTLVTGNRSLVTTNYVIAELVALLTIRTRLSRPEILHFVNQIKPLAQIVHIDAALDAAA